MRPLALLLALSIAACAAPDTHAPGPTAGTALTDTAQEHWIPQTADGRTTLLQTRICRPAGTAPARIAVISHGRAPEAMDRNNERLLNCNSNTARWFLARGYLIIAPTRIGYGGTGGPDAEADRCTPSRDYRIAAAVAARAIDAAIAYAETLPFARRDHVLVVGQSAGGLASIEYASHPRPEVTAVVNMAGGNGGHMQNTPNNNCYPDLLADAVGRMGATSPIPELWIYAANDSFFAPEIARAMHTAFTKAGGRADLVQPGPFLNDGHQLFYNNRGAAVWGPFVENYLKTRE